MAYRGKVKWFNNTKGYGFIEVDATQDAFVHYTDIAEVEDGYRSLEEGEEVEFDLAEGERGPKAVNVVRKPAPGADPST